MSRGKGCFRLNWGGDSNLLIMVYRQILTHGLVVHLFWFREVNYSSCEPFKMNVKIQVMVLYAFDIAAMSWTTKSGHLVGSFFYFYWQYPVIMLMWALLVVVIHKVITDISLCFLLIHIASCGDLSDVRLLNNRSIGALLHQLPRRLILWTMR